MLSPEQDNTENFEGSDIDSHSDLNEVEDEAVDDKADIDDTEVGAFSFLLKDCEILF